nr:immunoglobulin light chain junction region [Macaca mulatta]MOV63477.1 immunoglobulin light chain junction region [Macaca mulatta]MOV63840.1 immunoglobulin light chain junction region [Macaca mulatta]MOV63870.1 immunoglobulin light chain junction region [Macaca mulatta]MOV64092.1 immunoglobulin light chain junction region [Macaca mulatta]
CLQTKNSPWTF